MLSTHLPPLCRCWRHGPACHSQLPSSYSSCREPRGCLLHQSGSTHCLASLESCCCHSSGTTRGMWLSLRARQHTAPSREGGEFQGAPTSCCSLSTALVTPSWPDWWYLLIMVSFRFSLSSVFSCGYDQTLRPPKAKLELGPPVGLTGPCSGHAPWPVQALTC